VPYSSGEVLRERFWRNRHVKNERKPSHGIYRGLAAKCDQRWKQTVDKTKFMDELKEGSSRKKRCESFTKLGSFVPVINSVYTSAFYKHLWFFVKNVDLMEVYTQKVLDEFGHPCPPGHIQIFNEHRRRARTHERRSLTHAMLAAMPRPTGLSPDVNQRRADSRVLVSRSCGKSPSATPV